MMKESCSFVCLFVFIELRDQGKRFWKKMYTSKPSFFDLLNRLLQYTYLTLGHPVDLTKMCTHLPQHKAARPCDDVSAPVYNI